MARAASKEKKLIVLQIIKDNKNTLFRSFQNGTVDKIEKIQGWKKVLKKAQSLGLASDNRDWKYARDHLFGLWKSRALAKRSDLRKSYTRGERETKTLDVVDEAILDILGLAFLEIPGADVVSKLSIFQTKPTPKIATSDQTASSSTNDSERSIKRKSNAGYVEFLKQQILETELYKNKLEIMKLEKELGVPPSKFTRSFHNDTDV